MDTPLSEHSLRDTAPQDPTSWPTGRLLSAAARLVESRWMYLLDGLGLSHAGLIALHSLGTEALSQRTLGRRCQVTDQTISRTIDRLERAGYVTRELDPADRRRMLVRATAAGRDVHRKALEAERDDPAVLGALGTDQKFREQLLILIGQAEHRPMEHD